jgi:biotin operon repressor
MAKLEKVEGIGEFYAQKLREAGIATTQALLEKGASPQGREEIAEKTGISSTLILEWVNHIVILGGCQPTASNQTYTLLCSIFVNKGEPNCGTD